MKTILVGTDFSPASRKAFAFALQLAQGLAAEVIVVYVINTTDLRFALREEIEAPLEDSDLLKEKVEDYVKRKFESLLEEGKPYKRIRTMSVRGVPSIEITKLAKKLSAAFVVVGTKSRAAAAELILGSTSRELIQKAPCPVLVVRADTRIEQIGGAV